MSIALKPRHKNLADLAILICIGFCMFYGTVFYHTLMSRPGIFGNYYKSYEVSRAGFALYNIIIISLSFSTIIFYNKYLRSGKKQGFVTAGYLFICLILILIAANIYFQSKRYYNF